MTMPDVAQNKVYLIHFSIESTHYNHTIPVILGVWDEPQKAIKAFSECSWYIGEPVNWIPVGDGFVADPNKAPYRFKRRNETQWDETAWELCIASMVLNETFLQTNGVEV